MSDLKPCPFCGQPKAQFVWREKAGTVFVECWYCQARTTSGETEDEAAEAWNRRAALGTKS